MASTDQDWKLVLRTIEQQVDLGGATVWYGKKLSEENILLCVLRITVGSIIFNILVDGTDVVISSSVVDINVTDVNVIGICITASGDMVKISDQ